MNRNYIYNCVEELIDKYNTTNPYELMEHLGIQCETSILPHLKGYCTIIHGIPFAVINSNLSSQESRIVAAHELGHIILHSDRLLSTPAAHEDVDIYHITDKTEYQANMFAADLLIGDEEVNELARRENMDYFTIAKYLSINPQLLSFKVSVK